ncbi:protein DMR6-LIKE OXYGENASE 2-like [Cucurbita moschata]|uniref:Protein DMR6-LIKE OXYGENASE 2-like n=1 Tax=Cucurbita moschata TaxID=3662 RepID=A0A6J1EMN2_CUCMO|nr:protein DMR6-LIKE OXYGENASE 2-like [Cucurbita moschata]
MSATAKLLVADLASTVHQLPSRFVRPIDDRPNFSHVRAPTGHSFPVIDLHNLHGPSRADVVAQIGQACERDGFFLVKNHGVPEEMINGMLRLAREFFRLPECERLKSYSDDPTKTTRLSTSFNVKTEKVANWRDFLRLHCYPLELYVNEWPDNPPSFRKEVAEYCTSVRELTLKLLEAISESLGLPKDSIANSIGGHGQHMALNYYPPCPQPELTYGLPGHTDPNLITLLLQDQVPGLQALHDNTWFALDPIPNTFIINIGDQMQALSNDRYKSVLHRAVVNSETERISIPTFYCPSQDAMIGPFKELVDDKNRAVYRQFTYSEYYKTFWNEGLATKRCLDLFRVE